MHPLHLCADDHTRTMSTQVNPSTPKRKKTKLASTSAVTITPDHLTNQTCHPTVMIRLVPQRKPDTKCLDNGMTSPSSIVAAVHCYQSIRDALEMDHDHNNSNTSNVDSVNNPNYFLHTIFQHFGECDTFRMDLEYHTTNSSSPHFSSSKKSAQHSLSALERSFHKAVRHICQKACFLRAYAPIREFCFLWRDLCVELGPGGVASVASNGCIEQLHLKNNAREHAHECVVPTKSQILNGWKCQLRLSTPLSTNMLETPQNGFADTDNPNVKKRPTRKQGQLSSLCNMIYVSPNGQEFDKKVKLLKHLNDSFSNYSQSLTMKNVTSTTQPNPLRQYVTSINPLFSPLGLLEELFTNDPWKLLLSTIFLNKTQRNQVDVVLFQFLQRWPDALSASNADADEVRNIIASLGLMNKRSKSVVRFSNEYLKLIASKRMERTALSHDNNQHFLSNDEEITPIAVEFNLGKKDVLSLHQCGEYAWTAYQLFILKELPQGDTFRVCDHALQLYVEYKLGVCFQGSGEYHY